MGKIKEMVADAKAWLKLRSVQLAAAFGVIAGLLTENSEILMGVIAFIPTDGWTRVFFSIGVAILTFALPTLARMWPQNLDPKTKAVVNPEASDDEDAA